MKGYASPQENNARPQEKKTAHLKTVMLLCVFVVNLLLPDADLPLIRSMCLM